MRAYRVTAPDTAPQLCDVPVPSPGPDQVRIDIHACGLNFADLLMIKGSYQDTPAPPFTLGMEPAGTINALGEGVEGFAVGDRVMIYGGQGGLAQQGVFDAARAIRLPDAMGFGHAAAFQIAYGTSHLALDYRARLQEGETLLVTGAAGGVGLTAVEIGKLMGARVIAQARGHDKLEIARKAGADHLIEADTGDLRTQLLDLGGVDVVYDAVGGDVFKAAFRACRPEGRLLTIGFASGEVPQIPANHLMVKNLSVMGLYIGGLVKARPDVVRASMETLLDWYEKGRLHPHVSHILPLEQVGQGLDLLRSRTSTGKVVIRP